MKISLRYFASIRDLVGTGGEEITIPPGSTVEGLLETLKGLHGPLMDVERILVAVNGAYIDPGTVLEGGDKVALFPPVSGG
jgi:molybdopterin synthase sulfur carrier subunit